MARSLNVATTLTAVNTDLATETALYETHMALGSYTTTAKTKIDAVALNHKRRVVALQNIKTNLDALTALTYPDEVILTLTVAEFTAIGTKITAFDAEAANIVNSGL